MRHSMRLLLTGATGFLGRHVLQRLQQDSDVDEIIAPMRQVAAWTQLTWAAPLSKVRPVQHDLSAPFTNLAALGGAGLDGIIHLAAEVVHSRRRNPAAANMLLGMRHVLALTAEKRCRLVFVSTSGTVGCQRQPGQPADEHAPFCEKVVSRWPYYAAKIACEKLLMAAGLNSVTLRPGILLGPQDHRGRSTGLLRKFVQGHLPFIVAGGMHAVDVRDVAAAIGQVVRLAKPQPVYHLPGHMPTTPEFFAQVARAAAAGPGPRRAPTIVPYHFLWALAHVLPQRLIPDPVVIEMARHFWETRSLYAQQDLKFQPRPLLETLQGSLTP